MLYWAASWLACWTTGCAPEPALIDDMFTEAEWAVIETLSPLPELPPDHSNLHADDPAAQSLGHKLFFETSFSGPLEIGDDGTNGGLGATGERGKISCASCHMPESAWFLDWRSEPAATSLAAGWGHRNTPAVVNVAFYQWFGWAGENDSLWKQSLGTTEEHVSMNSSRLAIAHTLYDKYRAEYEALFGPMDPRLDPLNRNSESFALEGKPGDPAFDALPFEDQTVINRVFANFGKAIAAYERTLISREAPFDRYVAGDTDAIGLAAKRGLKLFIGKAGCVDCHNTPTFSDNKFHNLGVPQVGLHVPAVDEGRYMALTKLRESPFNMHGEFNDAPSFTGADLKPEPWQLGQFRTAQLRQIAETGPYMHTGAFESLYEVLEFYDHGGARYGFVGQKSDRIKPLGLSEGEILDLIAFLETLTGEPVPEEHLRNPHQPADDNDEDDSDDNGIDEGDDYGEGNEGDGD